MNLQTKFNLKDKVWYFKDSVPTKTEIKAIHVKAEKTTRLNILIQYELLRESKYIHEENLFLTQQELYASLED